MPSGNRISFLSNPPLGRPCRSGRRHRTWETSGEKIDGCGGARGGARWREIGGDAVIGQWLWPDAGIGGGLAGLARILPGAARLGGLRAKFQPCAAERVG